MKTDPLPGLAAQALVAAGLLTRLPLPHVPERAHANAGAAVWAFPLVGALTGGLACLLGLALIHAGAAPMLAAGAAIGLGAVLTGAMHEDGLADTADGFWGGWTRARRLEIMKDSHIGTYGVLALMIVTGLRWICYGTLLAAAPGAVLAAASLSRATMPLLMRGLPNARGSGLAHGVGRPELAAVLAGLGIACAVALISVQGAAVAGLLAALVTGAGVAAVARAKIGGQTGDVLGACQQLSETAVLICLATLLG